MASTCSSGVWPHISSPTVLPSAPFFWKEAVRTRADGHIVAVIVKLNLGNPDELRPAEVAPGEGVGQLGVAGEDDGVQCEVETEARLTTRQRECQRIAAEYDVAGLPIHEEGCWRPGGGRGDGTDPLEVLLLDSPVA